METKIEPGFMSEFIAFVFGENSTVFRVWSDIMSPLEYSSKDSLNPHMCGIIWSTP